MFCAPLFCRIDFMKMSLRRDKARAVPLAGVIHLIKEKPTRGLILPRTWVDCWTTSCRPRPGGRLGRIEDRQVGKRSGPGPRIVAQTVVQAEAACSTATRPARTVRRCSRRTALGSEHDSRLRGAQQPARSRQVNNIRIRGVGRRALILGGQGRARPWSRWTTALRPIEIKRSALTGLGRKSSTCA